MAKSKFITVRIEPTSLLGVDTLSDVVRQMNALTRLLTEFAAHPEDAEVKVLSLTKNSPLTAELQVVTVSAPRKPALGEKEGKRTIRPTFAPITRLERTLRSVNAPTGERAKDPEGLLAISDCARMLRDDRAVIEAPGISLSIDRSILPQIASKLGPVVRSYGNYTGVMEGLNVHTRPWNFTIYPTAGPAKVKCFFKEEMLETVRVMVKSMVRVKGTKDYFNGAPWPVRMHADDVSVVEPAEPGAWLTISRDLSRLWDDADPEDRSFFLESAA